MFLKIYMNMYFINEKHFIWTYAYIFWGVLFVSESYKSSRKASITGINNLRKLNFRLHPSKRFK